MNPIKLNYSEITFGGFHEIAIDLNEDKIKVNCSVSDQNKAAYEKKIALEEFMQNATKNHYDEGEKFYLSGDGEINWNKLETINYYENKAEAYSFIFELKDNANKRLNIKGKSSATQKDNPLKGNRSVNQYDDLLDAAQSTQKEDVFEKKYLKEAYAEIVAVIAPIATEHIFKNCLSKFEKEEKVKFGDLHMEHNGVYLKKPGWLFSKKVLVPWRHIQVVHEEHRSLIIDKSDPKTDLVILKHQFINKPVFQKIVSWGKK